MHLSHYALGLASRPLPKLSLRGNATYDGRDDKTSRSQSPTSSQTPFRRLGGDAPLQRGSRAARRRGGLRAAPLVEIGVGGKLDDIHYGPGQVVKWTQNAESWGRATITPIESLSFTLKGGNGLRKTSSFDTAALPAAENPMIREYDYAPRDRVFYTLTGAWTATSTITWSAEGLHRQGRLSIIAAGPAGRARERGSTSLTWTPRDKLSAYIDGGYERLFNLQNGYPGLDTRPGSRGRANAIGIRRSAGAGSRRSAGRCRWTTSMAPSYDNTDATPAIGLQQAFPQK